MRKELYIYCTYREKVVVQRKKGLPIYRGGGGWMAICYNWAKPQNGESEKGPPAAAQDERKDQPAVEIEQRASTLSEPS